jgi:N-dimethylarginine dimethylaminohydrolase
MLDKFEGLIRQPLGSGRAAVEKHSHCRLVLCKPSYFDVNYKINPWMRPAEWQTDSGKLYEKACIGWQRMHDLFIYMGFRLHMIEPEKTQPDLVFTANSAVVLDGKALLAHFRYQERQGEEKPNKLFFEKLKSEGVIREVAHLPAGIAQEGAGDCAWDPARKIFWAGYGPRSDPEAAQYIAEYFGVEVVSLELSTSEFYHLDTCLCPLSDGHVMYYPGAFSLKSQALIKKRVGSNLLIEVDREDAELFALNAVNYKAWIVLADCSTRLERKLKERGYEVFKVPVGVFNMAGGSVWCLALRIDNHR